MGETRVDLQHLLEDLRDAYPGSIEETILTEIMANSLLNHMLQSSLDLLDMHTTDSGEMKPPRWRLGFDRERIIYQP